VQCLKQLSKLEYDSTINYLQDQINRIVSNDELAVAGTNKKLSIESGADIEIVSDTTANPSQIVVKEKSNLVLEAGSTFDISEIALEAGQTDGVRAVVDNIQLSNVRGKDDVITMDDPLHADKGIFVDGDRFVVEDFSGNVESKGNAKIWGQVASASLDVNDKFKVSTDGTVNSKGSVNIENSLMVKDGVVAKFTANTDGTVEAKGLVTARDGLEVRGATAQLISGINTNNVFTVDATTGDTVVKGSFTATEGAVIGGTGTQSRLQGTTTVGSGDLLIVEGTLNVVGTLTGTTMVSTQTINVNAIASDVDFQTNKITNVEVVANAISGPLGSGSADTVLATTIGSSGLATLHSLTVTGDTTIGNIQIVGDALSGAVSVTSGTISSTGDAAVGGNAAVTGTLGVAGASTLAATTAAALTVDGAATLKGAVSMEGDVTFEKKMVVNEELQIGTGTTTTGAITSAGDGFKCATELASNTKYYPDSSSATYFTLEKCTEWAEVVFNQPDNYFCSDASVKPLLQEGTDPTACPGWTSQQQAVGFTGYFIYKAGNSRCALCSGSGTTAEAGQHHYQYGTISSGAVDFAKDGTLKTSGKATLASLEVEGQSDVVDLASSGAVTINTLQTSDDTKFKVESTGNVITQDLVVGGSLAVNSGADLSSTLTVAGATTVKALFKTVDVTDPASPVDGVTLGTDGAITAKSIHIDGIIVGKSDEFKVDDIGEVTASRVHAAGYYMPMFQESIAPVCKVNDGIILYAEGSCSQQFRKYTCSGDGSGGTFANQASQQATMGQCGNTNAGSIVVENVAHGEVGGCETGAARFCEELKTRQQCEGIIDISFQGAAQTLPTHLSDSSALAQTWTPVGSVINRLCMAGSLIALPAEPPSN